jgi:5-methylcytosine-specific restriction endonuclease McrA
MKTCSKCKLPKLESKFSQDKSTPDGLSYRCTQCNRENVRKYYYEHYEESQKKARERHKKTYIPHPRSKKPKQKKPRKIRTPAQKAEYYKTYFKKWRQENPDKHAIRRRIDSHTRRGREVNAEGSYSRSDVEQKFKDQNGLCFYCHIPLEKYEIDHFIPLVRGGSNWPDNIVLACPKCNNRKGKKLYPSEWTP